MIDLIVPIPLQEKITEVIKECCRRYRVYLEQRDNLFYEPYTNRRGKYCVTAAVLSGFAPGNFLEEGVQVTDLKYGLSTNELTQPELSTDAAIIQIYSNGAKPLLNKIVKDRCRTYNNESICGKRFVYISFNASKDGLLKAITINYPDANCQNVEIKEIYKVSTLIAFPSDEKIS